MYINNSDRCNYYRNILSKKYKSTYMMLKLIGYSEKRKIKFLSFMGYIKD